MLMEFRQVQAGEVFSYRGNYWVACHSNCLWEALGITPGPFKGVRETIRPTEVVDTVRLLDVLGATGFDALATDAEIERARAAHCASGTVTVDAGARACRDEDGTWLQGWLRVPE